MCNRPYESVPGASGTAELTGPECSSAPAPWVPRRPSLRSRAPRRKRPWKPRQPRGPSQSLTAPARALPLPRGARMTWLSRGTGELRKGFESGLCGRGKGQRLTAPTVPPPASGTPKDAGPWQGPRGPRCATHPLNTPSGPFRTALPPSPTPHPFPVPSRRLSPGREMRCPQGTSLSWRRALSPSVGGRREVWGAGGRDPTSVAQSPAGKSWDKDPRSPRGGGRRWGGGGRSASAPSGGGAGSGSGGQEQAAPGRAAEPAQHKDPVSLHTHLRRPSSPTGFFLDLPAQSWSEGSRQVPGTSSYPVPAAQRAGPAGVAGGSAFTSRGEGHTGSFAQLGSRGPRLRRTLLLFPGSPLSRRRASGSRLPTHPPPR